MNECGITNISKKRTSDHSHDTKNSAPLSVEKDENLGFLKLFCNGRFNIRKLAKFEFFGS